MTQQNGNQFDDDLTVGMDDEGSISTDSIDLFEFTGDEESPIARLKTIILSIDWEINDDILQQLDDELVDLGDIWADDKIKQIYIQGLNKIGKYIYKEKANAHPSAIKLLITFYHNLERIVSSDGLMSEEEKKQLLLEDVKKFDQLKSQIGKSEPAIKTVAVSTTPAGDIDPTEQIKVLNALVLGIDWEINDKELGKLGEEVQRLEGVFSQSKAKCILLQGIGALSSYIKKMRSNSNSKAFSLLHSFYDVLEKLTLAEVSADEEQQLILSEVEKFNAFKVDIAQDQSEVEVESAPTPAKAAAVTDVPAESLPVNEYDDEMQVASDVDSRLASVFGDISEQEKDESGDESIALEGVNVETEADDDSDEEALPFEDGSVAPALAEVEEESSFSVEKLAGDLVQSIEAEDYEGGEAETESLLVGVDVETVADDDSDEEPLPFEDGEIAPALTGSSDEGGFDEESLTADSDDLDNRLDSFFDDEVQTSSDEWSGTQAEASEQETEDEEQDLVEALSDVTDEEHESDEEVIEEAIAEKLSFFDEEEAAPEGDELFVDEDVTEEESSEDVAFAAEEELEPALSDEEDDSVSEELIDEAVAEKLSFFDDEEPEEDDELEGALFDETEELAFAEESDDEEALSFLDEEVEPQVIEEPFGSADSEELFDTDEIEFTVPGEITPGVESDTSEEKASALEDVIDFKVPGEEDTTETIFAAIAETSGDEVVFEAVDDDVEVDILPGEEYADSEDEDSEVSVPSGDEEEVAFLEEKAPEHPSVDVSQVVSSDDYVTLRDRIDSVQDAMTADALQDLLIEINRLRSSSTYSYTAKIFLQLLSTVCQYPAGTLDDSGDVNLSLMEEVYSGLKMNASSEVASEQVQKHLLACTSQVLLRQQKDINRAQTELSAGQQEAALVEDGDFTDNELVIEEAVSEASSEDGEDQKTQIKDELANIQKLFLDEIIALRKKFVDK